MDRPEAVCPGVATPDDHDALCVRSDPRLVEGTLADQVGRLKVVHGEVDAPQLAPGHAEVARAGRTCSQHHGIEVAEEGGR